MRPQPLICVTDVRASSRWYSELLGCERGQGGHDHDHEYNRLFSDGRLTLQLHSFEADHHHGPLGDVRDRPFGNGVLLWFETDDFEEANARAARLGAEVVMPRHRNPRPDHWELWVRDPDGYTVVLASPDGSAAGREAAVR